MNKIGIKFNNKFIYFKFNFKIKFKYLKFKIIKDIRNESYKNDILLIDNKFKLIKIIFKK